MARGPGGLTMPTTVARLEAVLTAKTSDFDRALSKSESRTQMFGKVANRAFLGVAAGIGALAKVGFSEQRGDPKRGKRSALDRSCAHPRRLRPFEFAVHQPIERGRPLAFLRRCPGKRKA
jgi:hypothetical protein